MNFGFENNKFYVEHTSCSRTPGNMKEESDRRALDLAEQGSHLALSLSAGLDSQSVLHSFWTQGIPINYVFFYMPGYNDIEYDQLQILIKKYGIKCDIIDLDLLSIKDSILAECDQYKVSAIHIIQNHFLSLLPKDWDVLQMSHDPFVKITDPGNFYYFQGFYDPEIIKLRVGNSLNRTGKIISYGNTSEFIYSYLNDDIFKSALYSSKYFDGNGLTKDRVDLRDLDRWDYYIKPLLYGKYWKDELIYFPKYGGWEKLPFEYYTKCFKKNAVVIPYFEFLEFLSSGDGQVKRFYENVLYTE